MPEANPDTGQGAPRYGGEDFLECPGGPLDPEDDRDGSAMQDAILRALTGKAETLHTDP